MIFTDQIGNLISLNETPKRIVSLVPSQTELLYDLGCGDRIVGQTLFCIHPKKYFKKATKIGGTKTPNIEKIGALEPDLIIASKEENRLEDILILHQKVPVWVSDVQTLNQALDMIKGIGALLNVAEKARKLSNDIADDFIKINTQKLKSCVYLIWKDPYMSVGEDTFIHDMLQYAGFENLLKHKTRYPEISIETLQQLRPEYVLLSSEPFPFKDKHIQALKSFLPKSEIILVDGEMFSWYGSRIQKAPKYFEALRTTIYLNQ